MKFEAGFVGLGRRVALCAAAIAIAMLALLGSAARARAAETIYWENVQSKPAEVVAFANIDGSGGGALNVGGVTISGPAGMSYDPANGRLYVSSSTGGPGGTGQIVWVAVDGSGAGVLDTGGAPVADPMGIAVDPKSQLVYWANFQENGSIGYAAANGGVGDALNIKGANPQVPSSIALDTTNGRIYWANTEHEISYANLDGSGGGTVDLPESERPRSIGGMSVDPAAGRLYYVGESPAHVQGVFWINTSGVGGGEVSTAGSTLNRPSGLAFDPTSGRFYWGNSQNQKVRTNAIGVAGFDPAVNGGITPITAPLSAPEYPVILKGPTGTASPRVTADGPALSCSPGGWAPDYPGSNVWGAPETYAYQWSKDGQAIPGATGSSYAATAAGSYSCSVTATNRSGSAVQTSGAATVTPASLTATLLTRKTRVKAGKTALVTLRLANGGDLPSPPVSVCATLTRKARKGLFTPSCAVVGSLGRGGIATATLRVKTRRSAKGTYKFTANVVGATVAPVKVSVTVKAAKKHKRKHHRKK